MTGVLLPVQIATASSWSLADYGSLRIRTDPAMADGLATVDLGQLDQNEMWLVDHAVVACDSLTGTQLRWYESSVSDLALLDGTSKGNFDVGDWPVGLQVAPSQSLVAQWSGASPGARGIVSIQYRVLRRVTS